MVVWLVILSNFKFELEFGIIPLEHLNALWRAEIHDTGVTIHPCANITRYVLSSSHQCIGVTQAIR